MRLFFALWLVLAAVSAQATDVEGLVSYRSPWSPQETLARLESAIEQGQLIRFDRIDHAAGAQKVGAKLRATTLIIFGHPKGGTPLLQCQQTLGIDLPLKALVWQDAEGQVWLSYNDPRYLARRHGAAACKAAAQLSQNLDALIRSVLKPQ